MVNKDLYSKLVTKRLVLKLFSLDMVTQEYVSWLNDTKINKFLETRHVFQTIPAVKSFVDQCIKSDDCLLYAIFHKEDDVHIGNIKIDLTDFRNENASIGYLIGNSEYEGCGYGTEAVNEVCRLCFDDLGIYFIDAGFIEGNISSEKLLLKCGFQRYSLAPNKFKMDNGRANVVNYYINKDEYLKG